jgi:hypothetical protein
MRLISFRAVSAAVSLTLDKAFEAYAVCALRVLLVPSQHSDFGLHRLHPSVIEEAKETIARQFDKVAILQKVVIMNSCKTVIMISPCETLLSCI